MKILILNTHLNAGGITSYLFTLTKHLQHLGHQVFLCSAGGERSPEFEELGAKTIALNIRTKSELSPKVYTSLGPLCRIIRDEKIDIIQAHTRVTQVMGRLMQKFKSIPYCTTCHGFFRPRLSRRLWGCWGQKTIAISPQVADHLRNDFHLSDDRIRMIPNGIDVEDFIDQDIDKDKLKSQYDIPSGPVIGIIARLSDVKGHGVLIDALPEVLAAIPNTTLVIVGQGKMEETIKAQVQAKKLQQRVVFIPQVNQTKILLNLFDIFVMPSLQEGLGLSVMEAQAAGVPVVASRVGGIPFLIDDEKTGRLVNPGDPSQLAQAMISLLKNPVQAKEFGARAQQHIQKEFSGARMTTATLAVFKECVENG